MVAGIKGGRRRRPLSGGGPTPSQVLRSPRLRRSVILSAFFVLVVSLTDLPALERNTGQFDIESETVASQTVRAAFTFEAEDLPATRERRDGAAAEVPEAYSVDLGRVNNQILTLNQRINTLTERRDAVAQALNDALNASNSLQYREEVITNAVAQMAAQWKEDPLFEGFPAASVLAFWLTPRLDSVPQREYAEPAKAEAGTPADGPRSVIGLSPPATETLQYAYAEALTTLARKGLEYVLTAGVIQTGNVPVGEGQDAPRIQILRGQVVGALIGSLGVSEVLPVSEIPDLNQARALLRSRIQETATEMEAASAESGLNWEPIRNAAFEMATLGIIDTLSPNQVVTEGNRQRARESVDPVLKIIDANQIIQQDGYRWNQQSRSDARRYWAVIESGHTATPNVFMPFIANAILVALVLAALLRATPVLATRNVDPAKASHIALLIVSGTLVVSRVMAFIEPTGLVVPIVAAAILLAILTNTRIAILAGCLTAILVSIQYGQDWRLLFISCAMSFAGVSSVYRVRRRGDMTRAAIVATVVGLVTYLGIILGDGTVLTWAAAREGSLIALNGGVCLFLVPGLLSPLERLFKITTDIQLLEYSDLNNEILGRLAIEVPATYAHSLMLGQLAEAAADAIGANGLLTRVSAYYHDIGKLRRPEYFGENQTGQNIHDELSPRLSARAIASHVTEGADMAREIHLPQPIIDGILEHHGTSLISFFYQTAKEQQKHGDVREEDYRYPGPKPQSRETAILMICDGVESGVRSIKNPNAERVREFIDRIIQARSEDRQFDECELTLKELDIIGSVIASRIISTHHRRIAYPPKPASEPARNVIPISGGSRES